jgi:SAM-dependent methyltransferase
MNKKLNLGCGSVFVDGNDWVNLDYQACHPSVEKADLLQRLPLPDCSCKLVYSSHFLEHIPKQMVPAFLRECLRVLTPGGVLRLALPDFEEMCKEYLLRRSSGEHEKADFLVIEIIDQCVRKHSGGELGKLYQDISMRPSFDPAFLSYIRQRNGERISLAIPSYHPPIRLRNKTEETFAFLVERLKLRARFFVRGIKNSPSSLKQDFRRTWFNWLLKQLPSAFREQNISLAPVGELHQWLWDFHQLQNQLISSGFVNVKSQSFNSSRIRDFPFFPLDMDQDGLPRKGRETMFVEAEKQI